MIFNLIVVQMTTSCGIEPVYHPLTIHSDSIVCLMFTTHQHHNIILAHLLIAAGDNHCMMVSIIIIIFLDLKVLAR